MTSKQADTARRPRVWVVTGSSSGFGHALTVAAIGRLQGVVQEVRVWESLARSTDFTPQATPVATQ